MNLETISTPASIAVITTVLGILLIYAFFVPKGNNGKKLTSIDGKSGRTLRFMSELGNDLYDALPEGIINQEKQIKRKPKLEALIKKANNPWNISVEEFIFISYLGGILGFAAGFPLGFLLLQALDYGAPVIVITVILTTLFGWGIPRMKYSSAAKARELEFTKELPEVLDLLIISISGGRTFAQALKEIMPNLKDTTLKTEFNNILIDIASGKTLNEALDNFVEKAPTESMVTFIRSLQSAIEVNAPLVETLESRAAASRQEFFAMIHTKTAQLESKIFMIITPTLLPAVILISVIPSGFQLMGNL